MYGSLSEKPSVARGGGQHLLIATDDPATSELLSTTLELAGYRTGTAGTLGDALARLAEHPFDLVVLDMTVPDLEGFDTRSRPVVAHRPAVLILTPYDSLGKVLPELGLGERDYVTKPLRIAEVLARIQVLLRDRSVVWRDSALEYGDLVLDDATCQARRGQRVLDLTPAEYRLLRHLLGNAHKVLSKEQIARYVWGEYRGDNAIEQLVSRLRRKVDRGGPALIHTRRGFGYWLGRTGDEAGTGQEANAPLS
ncbi:response regulator transcription factor [Streptomyces phyllanthi]|uniref:Response regulator transcription factor n=1 Tax=Streptomyces phyllanthi TaxID=1803180 RepID=A0A5N8VVL3_9ACTN|nr:response regulator transcription factor [Streptomyces phyllanthi]MPY39311.1 response regulator transcription factor [Streptomyces phyllanthi]